ncbi:MAG: nitrophenyl compound nitroreductase subunit ArsF family protein [Candidatus Micrarchaeota archaeon]
MRDFGVLIAFFAIVAIALFSFGCVSEGAAGDGQGMIQKLNGENAGVLYSPALEVQDEENTVAEIGGKDVSVEMFHFHGNTQCYSCVRLGELADNVINNYFKDELESGELNYMHINAQAPENLELAKEYQVSSISLQIGTTINGVKTRENLDKVWHYLEDEKGFENYLKPMLEKRLNGELN